MSKSKASNIMLKLSFVIISLCLGTVLISFTMFSKWDWDQRYIYMISGIIGLALWLLGGILGITLEQDIRKEIK